MQSNLSIRPKRPKIFFYGFFKKFLLFINKLFFLIINIYYNFKNNYKFKFFIKYTSLTIKNYKFYKFFKNINFNL